MVLRSASTKCTTPAPLIGDDEVAGSRVLRWTGKKSGLKHIVKENPTT